MASPFQQQALRRKLVYIGLIVLLFTVAGIFRITVVEAKAQALSLREQNVGEVELGGSALELSLTGSRGFVVCALWSWAIDAQKKNRWNEMELYVDSLTRLQPHFISPWLFQSWNFAYNVSVEADQVRDKLFYVFRGCQLLEKGERKNHCNPDMRFNIGYYQQHKVMQSDETNVYRCLYQMCSIPPPKRDIDLLMPQGPAGSRRVDPQEFEKFCTDHPQLVRRLHDKLRCNTPEDVVHFLDDNKRIPSIYKDDPNECAAEWSQGRYPLKDVGDRFPALPPPLRVRQEEIARGTAVYEPDEISYETLPDDNFNAYAASRAWSVFAVDALPPPSKEWPGEPGERTDPTRQRKSKMTVNLFRNHAPRSQAYIGERLQDEGWFGPEGWLITGWFNKDQFLDGSKAFVGTGQNYAATAWQKSFDMWERRGKANFMLLDPTELAEKTEKARQYLEPLGLEVGRMPPDFAPPKDDPSYEKHHAAVFMFYYDYSRRLTNFNHFYQRSLVEAKPEMIEARRTMFNARSFVRRGQRERAAEQFQSDTGLARLREILEKNEEFQKDTFTQEDLFELQVRYMKLMEDKDGATTFKPLTAAGNLLAVALPGAAGPTWTGLTHFALTGQSLMSALPMPEFEPPERMRLDGPNPHDPEHKPLISPQTRMQVMVRHGLMKAPQMDEKMMMSGVRPSMPGMPAPGTPGMSGQAGRSGR